MKKIRYTAAVVMLISGILHIVAFFLYPDYSASAGVMASGVIFPLTGSIISILIFGIPEIISLSALFKY
jgi:hypothetical protein